jgi:hypothetical protein
MSSFEPQADERSPAGPVSDPEQLRDSVDRRRTGDNREASSAAGQRGADEEDRETSMDRQEVARAARRELLPPARPRRWHPALAWLPVVVVVAVGAALFGWMRR